MKSPFLFTVFVLAGPLAHAGPSSSGGGPSILCRGPDQKIQTAQLLDLYEGEIREGLTIPISSTAGQTQLQAAFDRLVGYDWYIASDVSDALSEVEAKIAFLPPGVIMAPGVDLGDSYAAIIPDGDCELAYAGYFESDGTLRISQDIWDKLDETNRAALFMHEAIYKVARDIGEETNSLVSRELNAYLFSTVQDLSTVSDLSSHFRWSQRVEGWPHLPAGLIKVSSLSPTFSFQGGGLVWNTIIYPSDPSLPADPPYPVTIYCRDRDGNSKSWTPGIITQDEFPSSQCAMIYFSLLVDTRFDPSQAGDILIMNGDQKIYDAGAMGPSPGGVTFQVSSTQAIYLDRPLTIPPHAF